MARVFGPIQGAGTQVTERDVERQIQAAALGWTAYASILERGTPNELIQTFSRTDMINKTGGLIADSVGPDSARHFFEGANGAGGLLLMRVTDGNELPSKVNLYARRSKLTKMGELEAHDGGRWGGYDDKHTAEVTVVGDINEITIETGITTWTTDQWKGGTVELEGVPNTTYPIVGNTDTGTITVASDQTMAADLAAGSDPTNKRYFLELNTPTGVGLRYELVDGAENPSTEFGLNIYLDGILVASWLNLSTDPTSAIYWVDLINDQDSNYYVKAIDTWTGAHVASVRPANVYGAFTALSERVLTATIADFELTSTTGDPTFALGTTNDTMVAQNITLTMTAATTFDAVSDKFGALGSGTFGVEFDAGIKWVPPFTVTAGGTPATSGDTLTVLYKPLAPGKLAGGRVFPDKDTQSSLNYIIESNTHDKITAALGSTMLTDVAPVFTAVAATGSIQFVAKASLSDDETFTLVDSDGTSLVFYFNVTGGASGPGVEVDIQADTTADQVAATAKAAIDAEGTLDITTGTVASGLLPVTQGTAGAAGNTAITEAVSDVGFEVTGFAGGLDVTVNEYQVENLACMQGGRDGVADITDADYLKAWDVITSPFLQVRGQRLGLLKCATPGVTSTAVQKAGKDFAFTFSHAYRYEVPANITTEAGIFDYITDALGRSNYIAAAAQGVGYIQDPQAASNKLKQISLTGKIHGREARIAADNLGYHKAAAGDSAILPGVLKVSTGDVLLNEEFLNPRGIQVIKKKNGEFVIWGDRAPSVDPAWTFKHIRETMSHYIHTLLESFDFAIFEINDPATFAIIRTALQSFFFTEYANRALDNSLPRDEALKLKIDTENNTKLTQSLGDVHADITVAIVNTVERLRFSLGRNGVLDSAA